MASRVLERADAWDRVLALVDALIGLELAKMRNPAQMGCSR